MLGSSWVGFKHTWVGCDLIWLNAAKLGLCSVEFGPFSADIFVYVCACVCSAHLVEFDRVWDEFDQLQAAYDRFVVMTTEVLLVPANFGMALAKLGSMWPMSIRTRHTDGGDSPRFGRSWPNLHWLQPKVRQCRSNLSSTQPLCGRTICRKGLSHSTAQSLCGFGCSHLRSGTCRCRRGMLVVRMRRGEGLPPPARRTSGRTSTASAPLAWIGRPSGT